MYDRNEERRRRELDVLNAKEAKLREELANLRNEARSAKSRLKSTTRHEEWHSRRLAHLDRLAGYDGEMASARIYVRGLNFDDYVAALRVYAEAEPTRSNLEIEIMAVRANLELWHDRGEAIVLDRERQAADAERASWESWQVENPDATGWRETPMSRRQYFLISRTANLLDIKMPGKMSRGEAFDWLAKHGGNQRLNGAGTPVPGGAPSSHQGGSTALRPVTDTKDTTDAAPAATEYMKSAVGSGRRGSDNDLFADESSKVIEQVALDPGDAISHARPEQVQRSSTLTRDTPAETNVQPNVGQQS